MEDVQESFDSRLSGIEWETVREDREDKGVEDTAPVGIIEALNGVPKNAEGTNSGVGLVCHDGHVMCPIKTVVDEDAKIADDGGLLDSVGTGAGGPGVDGGDKTANEVFSSTRRSKGYELSLICVTF